MKTSTTKGTKKSAVKKTKKEQTNEPVLKMDLRFVDTDKDAAMVKEMAWAKMDAGRMLDVSEVMNLLNSESEEMVDFYKSITNSYRSQADKMYCKICKLEAEITWLKRPWYKKLMFWKKKPEFTCPCEGTQVCEAKHSA